ncbi:hypothetical protein [Desulfatirhabdium butyrativorans]|uniref:hypothetical protein n=1 Tax=Desulfatirhabdium butyrativorans TaxID=340467 RepID=UPI000487EA9F|nr:hypothetical protein [Desulfatirhabdium butyrativorans]
MKLDEVVVGPVYLDTNVLYMYLRTDPVYLPAISEFFHRIVRGGIDARIGVPLLMSFSIACCWRTCEIPLEAILWKGCVKTCLVLLQHMDVESLIAFVNW